MKTLASCSAGETGQSCAEAQGRASQERFETFFKVTASVTEVAPVTLFPSRESAVGL